MKKRGQITIFVILGIVLLIIVGGGLYFRSTIIGDETEPEETIPQEYTHIKKFVETCMYEIGKEGISKLGEKGGYIYPHLAGIVSIPGFPTKGNSFEFVEGSDMVIPYWYYMKSPDSCISGCQFDSEKPDLTGDSVNSIESQIARYIVNNLPSCINDFEDFKEGGFDITRSENIAAKVTIGEASIVVNLNNKVTINENDVVSEISMYSAELDVKLKQMFDLATQIVNYGADNRTKFLEAITRETIAIGSIGENPTLPPFRDSKITLGAPDYWLLEDVRSSLQTLLMTYIPSLQVLFAKNSAYFITDDEYINAIYNQKMILLNSTKINLATLNNYNVNFVYLGWWPMYLKVKPGGQLIKPELNFRISNKFFNFGFDNYKFAYDVSYPVLVVLEDENAFNNEGFTLQFGLEANLRNNEPVIGEPLPEIEAEEEENVSIDFCGLEQRNSGGITIRTKDSVSGESLGDVALSYHCFEELCVLGNSVKIGDDAKLITQLPICLGGYFTASKQGYMTSITSFSTNLDVDGIVDVELIKEKTFNVAIEKHSLIKSGDWIFRTSSSALDDNEKLFLLLERVAAEGEPEYIKFVNVEGIQANTLDLVPGNYTIEGTLMRELGPGNDPEKIILSGGDDIDDMEINSTFLEGGVQFDINHTWEFTLDNYDKNKITFHVVGLDVDSLSSFDDLEQMDAYIDYSVSERALLEPEFE
ncbi:hypothetical protein HQ533_05975 [Candidatus Woesearchaeota archaeon]|nr:hypothetical protein [Candidatus Woesearchaeota archaeon]